MLPLPTPPSIYNFPSHDRVALGLWHQWWGKSPLHTKKTIIRDGTLPQVEVNQTIDVVEMSYPDEPPRQPPLGFGEGLGPGVHDLLVRREYVVAVKRMEDTFREWGFFVVVGHPSVGLTMFLYYLLWWRLAHQRPTLFQTHPGTVLFFGNEGVAQVPVDASRSAFDWKMSMKKCWALVDISERLPKPGSFLARCGPPWGLLMTSCPRQDNWCTTVHHGAYPHFMAPWTLPEIIQLRGLRSRHGNQPSEMQLSKFYNDFGPSIRDVFQFADHMATYKVDLLHKLGRLGWPGVFESLKSAMINYINRDADRIVIVEPDKDDRVCSSASIITKNVLTLLWVTDVKDRPNRIFNPIRSLLFNYGLKNEATVKEIFELQMRNLLSHNVTLKLQKMVAGPAVESQYTQFHRSSSPSKIELATPDLQTVLVSSMTDFHSKLTPNTYFTSVSNKFQVFDPFLITEEENQVYINIFGVAVSPKHIVSIERLRFVQNLLKEQGICAKLRYILVLPGFRSLEATVVNMPVEVQEIDVYWYTVRWRSFEEVDELEINIAEHFAERCVLR